MIRHGGGSPLYHRLDWQRAQQENLLLTQEIIATCDTISLTNEILFNTLLCRQLRILRVEKNVSTEQLLDLAARFRVSFPWSLEYDALRGMPNERFQSFPLMIVFPLNEVEVRYFVHTAQQHCLLISIRSGGHAAEGTSGQGEMVMDLTFLSGIDIEREAGVIHFGAGTPLGLLYEELFKGGMVTPLGTCPGVSSGLVLGGGIGPMVRHLGLSCDALLGVRILLADGEYLDVDATHHSDLFRAIRGGGNGNFGVVTRFSMQCSSLGMFFRFEIEWNLLHLCRGEAGHIAAMWHNHFLTFAPSCVASADLRLTSLSVILPFTGWVLVDAEEQVRELINSYWFQFLTNHEREMAEVKITQVNLQSAAIAESGEQPQLQPFYIARSWFVERKVTERKWAKLIQFMWREGPLHSAEDGVGVVLFDGFGPCKGSPFVNNPTQHSVTVFPTRTARSWTLNYTYWRLQDMETQAKQWSSKLNRLIRSFSSQLSYYNWQDTELGDRYLHSYFANNVAFLKAVKEKYDPGNFFCYKLGIETCASKSYKYL